MFDAGMRTTLAQRLVLARFILETDHPSRQIILKDYESNYRCVSCGSSRVLYWTSFLDGFPRKEDQRHGPGKFQNGGKDTTREAFFEEKKSCRRRTPLFPDNEY